MAIDVNNIQTETSANAPVSKQKSASALGDHKKDIDLNVSGTNNAKVSSVPGLTASEINDPNSIKVTIADPKTPIVVLYGPPSCGKTMTLVRLARYLKSIGYSVVPEKTFRPSYDTNYKEMCEHFDEMINSDNAAQSTSHIGFMLVKVLKNGKPICQLLEAPGELYFTPEAPNAPYPPYADAIFAGQNRKLWAIMLEPDWADLKPRANYVTRIKKIKTKMGDNDKVLFVYNKIDLTDYVIKVGHVNIKEAIHNVENLYPNIFVPFQNQNPLTKLITKYNCEFVPFMTGTYVEKMSGGLTYTEGSSVYAQKLWNAMLKLLKG